MERKVFEGTDTATRKLGDTNVSEKPAAALLASVSLMSAEFVVSISFWDYCC